MRSTGRACPASLPGLPLGHPGRRHRAGQGASRRHRRPVGRHAGRPGRPADPGRARRGQLPRRDTRPPRAPRRCARRRWPRWTAATASPALAENAVLPVIGTKELIAWLPTLLGLGPDDARRGARTGVPDLRRRCPAGRRAGAARRLADPARPASRRRWSTSTRRATRPGAVLGVDHLRKVVGWARERGVLVASDECYLGLGWDAEPLSVLHPSVCDGDHTGLLAIHSLSKSVLAGRLPGRLRRRRPRGGRRAAGGAQARRDDGADAGAGRDGGRARRRRARARAAERYAPAPRRLLPAVRDGRASPSTTPRPGSTCGPPAASRAATPWPGWRSAASWSRPASSTGRAAPARADRADRHRRAHRPRRRLAQRSESSAHGARRLSDEQQPHIGIGQRCAQHLLDPAHPVAHGVGVHVQRLCRGGDVAEAVQIGRATSRPARVPSRSSRTRGSIEPSSARSS